MDKKMEKKKYVAPQMTVVEMKTSAALLQGSGYDGTGFGLFDDDEGEDLELN